MRFAAWMLIAMVISTPALAEDVKSGTGAWARKDYLNAIAIWRPLAASGNADAQFNLAQAYRLGRGVSVDLPEAMSLYTRAANAGHVDAQTQLGVMLFQSGNQLSGLRWLHAAADGGEPRAQLIYGTALFNGDGLVTRDPEAAYRYVARAVAQGLAPAKATLAEMDASIPVEVRARAIAGLTPANVKATSAKPGAAKAPIALIGSAKSPSSAIAPSKNRSATVEVPVSVGPPHLPKLSGMRKAWRIQLGAFGQRAAAEALFRKFSAGPLAGRQSYLGQVGAVTRLQVGPYRSKAMAGAACATLSARGQPCFVVAPH